MWTGQRMRTIIIILLAFFSVGALAQTEEPTFPREKRKSAATGFLTFLAPTFDYYDKNRECYNPPAPIAWLGSSWLNNDSQGVFQLRSGVFNKIDIGFTILQISWNLYRGMFGVSAGFQLGGILYRVAPDYRFEKDGHIVEFIPIDDEHKDDNLDFMMARIPLLIGTQTNNRLFSVQTGLGLCHTTRFGVQWLVTAGLGPVTVSYSHNLTPLFKLTDGTKAYPSSITIGFDLWYYYCRFTRPPQD